MSSRYTYTWQNHINKSVTDLEMCFTSSLFSRQVRSLTLSYCLNLSKHVKWVGEWTWNPKVVVNPFEFKLHAKLSWWNYQHNYLNITHKNNINQVVVTGPLNYFSECNLLMNDTVLHREATRGWHISFNGHISLQYMHYIVSDASVAIVKVY